MKKSTKKKLVAMGIGAGILCTGIGFYFGIKHDKVKLPEKIFSTKIPRLHQTNPQAITNTATVIKSAAETLPVTALTGIKKTAQGLGHEVARSSHEINKLLIKHGLATREPYGPKLTEPGSKYGERVLKVTKYGHPFDNIEWDTSVLKIIFTEAELAETKRKNQIAQQLLRN